MKITPKALVRYSLSLTLSLPPPPLPPLLSIFLSLSLLHFLALSHSSSTPSHLPPFSFITLNFITSPFCFLYIKSVTEKRKSNSQWRIQTRPLNVGMPVDCRPLCKRVKGHGRDCKGIFDRSHKGNHDERG